MSIAWSISKIEKKNMHSFMHLLLFFYFKLYLNIHAVNKFIHVLLWKRILPFILNSGIPKMQLFVAIVNLRTFVAKRFIINVVVGFFLTRTGRIFWMFFFFFSVFWDYPHKFINNHPDFENTDFCMRNVLELNIKKNFDSKTKLGVSGLKASFCNLGPKN